MGRPSSGEIDAFTEWIMTTPLLHHLRDHQEAFDTSGPLEASQVDENFRLAMTLRDVTVYLRFPKSESFNPENWEARLGDLDIKSADKSSVWRAKEKELINGGWYEGTEKLEDSQPVTCYLSQSK